MPSGYKGGIILSPKEELTYEEPDTQRRLKRVAEIFFQNNPKLNSVSVMNAATVVIAVIRRSE